MRTADREGTQSATPRRRGSLGVRSIEVGLKLLRPLIDASRPLNLKPLADAAGFAPPKAHRYLVSLINVGLIEQDPETGRYGLGVLAFELGLSALGLLDHNKLARTTLSELEAESGQSACLFVWGTRGPTVAAVESSPQSRSVFVAMRVGSNLPLLRSAAGRIFLAYLPREVTSAVLAEERKTTRMSAGEIDALVKDVRRRKFGTSKDAAILGITAFSAPIFDHEGRLVYALVSFGPTGAFDLLTKRRVLSTLQAKAHQLSTRLGFREERKVG